MTPRAGLLTGPKTADLRRGSAAAASLPDPPALCGASASRRRLSLHVVVARRAHRRGRRAPQHRRADRARLAIGATLRQKHLQSALHHHQGTPRRDGWRAGSRASLRPPPPPSHVRRSRPRRSSPILRKRRARSSSSSPRSSRAGCPAGKAQSTGPWTLAVDADGGALQVYHAHGPGLLFRVTATADADFAQTVALFREVVALAMEQGRGAGGG